MAEINFFIYKPGRSVLHKIHPSLKFVFIGISSIIIVRNSGWILLVFGVLLLVGIIAIKMVKAFFKNWFVLLGLFIIGIISPIYSIRIMELVLLGILFTGTTKPQDVALGIYTLTRSRKISKIMSLTVTLIPTFLISWVEIKTALNSRGLYLKKNPIFIMKAIAIPILVTTFKRADEIALAMESRGYR